MRRAPRVAFVLYVLAASFALAPAGAAQTDIEPFDSREAFNAAAARLSALDFEADAPARGFRMHRPPEGLVTGGVAFRASGGARFGPGVVYVLSTHYAGLNPLYHTGTGALLSWAAPNQAGSAALDVTFAAGVTAVGAEVWTQQPQVSRVVVTATTAEGRSLTAFVNTRARPAGSFVGFISETPIVSVSFRLPRGQTGLLLDNFVYGRRAEGRAVRPPAAEAVRQVADEVAALFGETPPPAGQGAPPAGQTLSTPPRQSPATPPGRTPDASPSPAPRTPAPPAPPTAQSPNSGRAETPSSPGRGTIAYIRGGTEIRLVEADGSNDRRLWTHPLATEAAGLYDLAWRPDGEELAFSSGHHGVVSLYHADIYAVRPDGTGLRKITNPPDHAEFARHPKGTVTVTLSNEQPAYRRQQASAGVFFVYVAGADEPQAVTLPPGSSKTLVFKSVADFGDHAQPVVAIYGQHRWFMPGVDVRAGRNVEAPPFAVSGDGIELLGAFRPVWRADGSRVSYRSGVCVINSAPARPAAGEYSFRPLFRGDHPSGACAWDWGPTPALADQLLYTENSAGGSAVYRIREGGTHPGAKLHVFSDINYQLLHDLRWLPDGSGFLYSQTNLMQDASNIFRYDFETRRATEVTRLEGEFARRFDVSPDGQWVVFERSKAADDYRDVDLWVVRADGTGARLLVRGGLGPAWR
ncbi:MAG TPA: hypothetical protein VN228_18805 [Pyrinomonadaceae bacterium]|nr:hypothetical protein [Pyrinomonadaceae bacterium]